MQLLNHFKSKPTTIEERFQLGKELRKKFPRIAQGEYKPAPDRADPVSILEEQAKTRFRILFLFVMQGCLLHHLLFCVVRQQLWQQT